MSVVCPEMLLRIFVNWWRICEKLNDPKEKRPSLTKAVIGVAH